MAENYDSERTNGVTVEDQTTSGVTVEDQTHKKKRSHREDTLYGVLHHLMVMSVFPDPNSNLASTPLLQRIKISVSKNGPRLREASSKTGRDVLLWARRGSPLRALFVISVGTIGLITLTGLLVFMLFFLAATFNAIVISLFMSLAAAGGFLALFFACVTAIYIGALSVAGFVISTATISAIVAAMIATGWIGFFLTVWLAVKKCVGLAKHSLNVTGSALSAYSSTRPAYDHDEMDKASDRSA